MKRTSLVLDEDLLKTATLLLGTTTHSATVNHSLKEAIRICKARGITEFIGKEVWEGDLSQTRENKPGGRGKKKR